MDFAEGGQVNDREYMRKYGINVNEVREMPLTLKQSIRSSETAAQQTALVTTPPTQDRLISNFTTPMLI